MRRPGKKYSPKKFGWVRLNQTAGMSSGKHIVTYDGPNGREHSSFACGEWMPLLKTHCEMIKKQPIAALFEFSDTDPDEPKPKPPKTEASEPKE